VRIGNADYRCSCVRYVTSADQTDHRLTIGLAVGLGLLLIIIIILIIIVVVVCRRRRGKAGEERISYSNNGTGLVHLDDEPTTNKSAQNGYGF